MWYVTAKDESNPVLQMTEGNMLIVECESLEEAERVQYNLNKLPKLKYADVVSTKPDYAFNLYSISYKTKADVPSWFS